MKKAPLSSNKLWRACFAPLLICCLLAVPAVAQDEPIVFQYINMMLNRAIEKLIAEKGLAIAYQSDLIEKKRITAICEGCTPEQALEKILASTTLTWEKVNDRQFILKQAAGSIEGYVSLQESSYFLSGIEVRLIYIDPETGEERDAGVLFTDNQGRFRFQNLKPGKYKMNARAEGFKEYNDTAAFRLKKFDKLEVPIFLEDVEMPVLNIKVLQSFDLIRDDPINRKMLERSQIHKMPSFGNDIGRSVEHLAGVTNGDLSATIQIRGGDRRETMVVFDDVTLDEPYHFREVFSGLLSIVDPEIVGRVELLTAGMPIEQGNYMSGIFNIHPVNPNKNRSLLELTTISAKFKHEGVFAEGRGNYFIVGREGIFYDDIVLTEFTEISRNTSVDTNVDYTGLYGRMSYKTEGNEFVVGGISASDDGNIVEFDSLTESVGQAKTEGGYHAAWLKHNGWLTNNLLVASQLVSNGFDRLTNARDELGIRQFRVNSTRDYQRNGFRQDWSWWPGDSHALKWGVEYWRETISLDYANTRKSVSDGNPRPLLFGEEAETEAMSETKSNKYGFYLGDRYSVTAKFTIEAGLRYDKHDHTGESNLSTRLYANWAFNEDRNLKAGWGRYHQPQALYQLQIEDGVTTYNKADRADQFVLSYEELFGGDLYLRADLFLKQYDPDGPKFINFLDPHDSFAEAQPDRIRIEPESGLGQGIELTLSQHLNQNFSWMANYTLSEVYDKLDGQEVYRYYDQRHAFNINIAYNMGESWSADLAWHYHTGWHTTDVTAVLNDEGTDYVTVIGPYYEEFFPAYHRVDMRFQRKFLLRGRHSLGIYVEITNLLSRDNIQNTGDHALFIQRGQPPFITRDEDTWVPQTANFGVRWNFE